MAQSTARRTELPRQVEPEPFQHEAWEALTGDAKHVLIYGGSGSGKTHTILLWLLLRGLSCPKASQAIFRFHFTDLRTSIVQTLEKVRATYWPHDPDLFAINKTTLDVELRGGGHIYLGGLDDAKRTEKILGQEHSTIYLNEASQISHPSYTKALTRLRQVAGGLDRKIIVDENPPQQGHWTEREWIKGIDYAKKKPFSREERADRVAVMMHPANNPYLPEDYKILLQNMPPRERERFWDGKFGSGTANPLWTIDSIEAARIKPSEVPESIRIAVVCDPSGCRGPEDTRSDEVGISVVGESGGVVYVLEDASGRMGPDGPDGWAAKLIHRYCQWGADFVAAEKNFGGEMVAGTLRSAVAKYGGTDVKGSNVPYHELNAAHGKSVRAEPVSTLMVAGGLKFVGNFPELEEQLCAFSSSGYVGSRSPDRADAMVWGAYALGVVKMPGAAWGQWVANEADAAEGRARPPRPQTDADAGLPVTVPMRAPSHFAGSYFARDGSLHQIVHGRLEAKPEDVEMLTEAGFQPIT